MNVKIAGHVGTPQLKQFLMVNIKMVFYHPKYYKELRKLRNKSDQVISANKLDGDMKVRASGPGLKRQAPSTKLQASSAKLLKK